MKQENCKKVFTHLRLMRKILKIKYISHTCNRNVDNRSKNLFWKLEYETQLTNRQFIPEMKNAVRIGVM